MERNKVIIFDFDGTIADTFSTVVDIVNEMSDQFGFEKLTFEDISLLRHLRAQDALKIFKISIFKVPALIFAVKAALGKKIVSVPVFEGLPEALHKLKVAGCSLSIVSSNTVETIEEFLRNNNLEVFDFVHCEKDLFGKGKVLNHLIRDNNISREDTMYVGDETRDIEAARKAGIKIISVSWGFNAVDALEKLHPDFLINRPEELLKVCLDN